MVQVNEASGWLGRAVRSLAASRPARFAALLIALSAAVALGMVSAGADGSFAIVRNGSAPMDGTMPEAEPEDRDLEAGRGGGDGLRAEAGADGAQDDSLVVVDVGGAVMAPGVYELAGRPRVGDAIEAAGGLRDDADVSGLNRASPVADGSKVHVPAAGEAPAQVPGAAGTSGSQTASAGPVNINTASELELEELPGIGPSTAAAIVEERAANGPFSYVDDLLRVTGIGEKKLERIRGLACT